MHLDFLFYTPWGYEYSNAFVRRLSSDFAYYLKSIAVSVLKYGETRGDFFAAGDKKPLPRGYGGSGRLRF